MPTTNTNFSTLISAIDTKAQSLASSTSDPKDLVFLGKTIEALNVSTTISDIIASGDTQVTNVNTAGTTQVAAVNTAGTTQVAAVNAAGSGYVTKTNNLSDLSSISTARTNLGVIASTGGTFTGAINMGANNITTTGKILYANVYSQLSDLPSASTYHGMFAHVHATGKGYYAHAGVWIPLVNEDTSGNVSLGGNLTITGGLTVNGTTTTINSTTLDVDDLNITVAKGAADAAAANGAGLTVDGASATFNYANTGDKWTMNKSLDVTGEMIADSYNETYAAITSSSNAITVNLHAGNSFSHTLTENTTFTFSNPPASGISNTFSLKIVQDGSASGFTVTWPSSVDWPTATAPTLTATASAVDYFVFTTHDGGTTWYGFTAGQALG
jgi:hypothetical protein